MKNILDDTKAKMTAAIDHLKQDLKSLRTSRANPSMVEGIAVEIYGSQMRIKELAMITAPESRMLLITPFDPKNVPSIAKAIEKANIGLQPQAEGNAIRIKIPPMEGTMRQKIAKMCDDFREKAKISIRNARRDGNEALKKDAAIPEDDKRKMGKKLDEFTTTYCDEADSNAATKQKEILTV
jgi:ribosome recycling factor